MSDAAIKVLRAEIDKLRELKQEQMYKNPVSGVAISIEQDRLLASFYAIYTHIEVVAAYLP